MRTLKFSPLVFLLALHFSVAHAAAPDDCAAKLDYLADLTARAIHASAALTEKTLKTYPLTAAGATATGIAYLKKRSLDANLAQHRAEVARLKQEFFHELKMSGMKWGELFLPKSPPQVGRALKYAARGAPLGVGLFLDLLLNSGIAEAATMEEHYAAHPGALVELDRTYACSLIHRYPDTVGASLERATAQLQSFHQALLNHSEEL